MPIMSVRVKNDNTYYKARETGSRFNGWQDIKDKLNHVNKLKTSPTLNREHNFT